MESVGKDNRKGGRELQRKTETQFLLFNKPHKSLSILQAMVAPWTPLEPPPHWYCQCDTSYPFTNLTFYDVLVWDAQQLHRP